MKISKLKKQKEKAEHLLTRFASNFLDMNKELNQKIARLENALSKAKSLLTQLECDCDGSGPNNGHEIACAWCEVNCGW